MVWVHFDSAGVREVYVKSYEGSDDSGIYGHSRHYETGEDDEWGEEALKALIH